ncbi:MAG TPA: sodium-dependent bicarbonate transport family permease [Vicinamibacterales bacterium]|nr:sodium-dependent bicarbonate transport family permease [Vicinamibacterales bacterium]
MIVPSIDPVILFFILGLAAGRWRADVKLPPAIYEFLIVLLLLTIGLKGGIELAQQPFLALLPQMLLVVAAGVLLPLAAYPVLRHVGRLPVADAASIAAHYGSVSVGTFAVASAYLAFRGVTYEERLAVFLVLLEMPAIFVGIVLARRATAGVDWRVVSREVLLGRSMVLLIGGLAIGWIAGADGIKPIEAMFMDLFKGALALFLLEMGLIAATQLDGIRKHGIFIVIFGIAMPLTGSVVGAVMGWGMGLSIGGTALLSTLMASASYIAVPAAMRLSIPAASPALSLGASLGVTFPFNVILGIPLYLQLAQRVHGVG